MLKGTKLTNGYHVHESTAQSSMNGSSVDDVTAPSHQSYMPYVLMNPNPNPN